MDERRPISGRELRATGREDRGPHVDGQRRARSRPATAGGRRRQADVRGLLVRNDDRPDVREHVPEQRPRDHRRRRPRPDRLDDRKRRRLDGAVLDASAQRHRRPGDASGVLPPLRCRHVRFRAELGSTVQGAWRQAGGTPARHHESRRLVDGDQLLGPHRHDTQRDVRLVGVGGLSHMCSRIWNPQRRTQ